MPIDYRLSFRFKKDLSRSCLEQKGNEDHATSVLFVLVFFSVVGLVQSMLMCKANPLAGGDSPAVDPNASE